MIINRLRNNEICPSGFINSPPVVKADINKYAFRVSIAVDIVIEPAVRRVE